MTVSSMFAAVEASIVAVSITACAAAAACAVALAVTATCVLYVAGPAADMVVCMGLICCAGLGWGRALQGGWQGVQECVKKGQATTSDTGDGEDGDEQSARWHCLALLPV